MPTVPSLPRSFLYVPGNQPDLFPKGARSGADAVILDLEDAVPLRQRDDARRSVVAWLAQQDAHAPTGPQWWVRLDPAFLDEDLASLLTRGLAGVVLAKAESATVGALDRVLNTIDGVHAQTLRVIGLVETASAHAGLAELVRQPRLLTLGIGEVDLLADLGITLNERTAASVDALRLEVVRQCTAAGLVPPVAPTSTHIQDLHGFRESSELLRDLGFGARTAVHPRQIEVIHQVLTPSTEKVTAARDVVERFERADRGVAVDAEGRLIDAAVVRHAQLVLDRAEAAHG